jgi:ligand-binding sensor domain-containing protein
MSRLFADVTLGRAMTFALWVVLCITASYSQQLSIRHYDTHDGLAHNRVSAIHQDAKGYLWIGTWEGLSRFDGYKFVTYDTRGGLGHIIVNSIKEDGQGRLWVATNGGGVSRLIDEPVEDRSLSPNQLGRAGKRFESFLVGESIESNRVNALVFDSQNNLWCGTDAGLYRASPDERGKPKFELVVPHKAVYAGLVDHQGRLWFGAEKELIEFVEGQVTRYDTADDGAGYGSITCLLADRRGVFQLVESRDSRMLGQWERFPMVFQPTQHPELLFADSEGALWVGIAGGGGLIKYKEGQQLYTTAQGFSDDRITALDEDLDGNLWVGTVVGGLCKLSGEMLVSFTRTQGLPSQIIFRVIEDRKGRIYASTGNGLAEVVGGKAVLIQGSQTAPFNSVGTAILQDRRGDWWVGTSRGLFRFQGPELQLRRGKKFTAADGLIEEAISGIYEDSNGRIWIKVGGNLYYSDSPQAPSVVFRRIPLGRLYWPTGLPDLMVGDREGALWTGGFARLVRLSNGVVRDLQPINGLPETETRALFLDSRGWLWIGLRNKGVSMTKDPAGESPEFVNYSTASGLASDFVLSIAEDDAGRIYLGTFKGVDRLEPASGEIRHFTTTDGLAGDWVGHCLKDHLGNIWIATSTGLSKLNPHAERTIKRPPPIYLSLVQLAGEALPLAETGAVQVKAGDLPASRNNLLIEFIGLSFQSERALKYQYKLEGADVDWSALTEQRSVNYARLAPGHSEG